MELTKTSFIKTKVFQPGVIYHIKGTKIYFRRDHKNKQYIIRLDGSFTPMKLKTKKAILELINEI
jgi:hypothetical protein